MGAMVPRLCTIPLTSSRPAATEGCKKSLPLYGAPSLNIPLPLISRYPQPAARARITRPPLNTSSRPPMNMKGTCEKRLMTLSAVSIKKYSMKNKHFRRSALLGFFSNMIAPCKLLGAVKTVSFYAPKKLGADLGSIRIVVLIWFSQKGWQ